jgi:zinc/manganese transport system ATP-binding protein
VHEVIELVGASAYAERPIGSLSGGEQQRLLIAQAIVHRPELLLLDEPLASLDYPNQMAITALVGGISREEHMTVVMVTHDVNPLIGQAQKLVYIAKQGVVSGTPGEVLTGPVLSRIYGSPVEVHHTAGGRILVVGEPEGRPIEPIPGGETGRGGEDEHECCEHSG